MIYLFYLYGHLNCFQFFPLADDVTATILYMSIDDRMQTFLLSTYLGVKFLGQTLLMFFLNISPIRSSQPYFH